MNDPMEGVLSLSDLAESSGNEETSIKHVEEDTTKPEEEDEVYYVVASGRRPSDTGIYKTWTEAQQRTNGVSGADHKRCNGLQEATEYLRAAKINEENIDSYTRNIDKLEHTAEGRRTRNQSPKDYRALSSGKSMPARREKPKDQNEHDKALRKEIERTRNDLEKALQREKREKDINRKLEKEIQKLEKNQNEGIEERERTRKLEEENQDLRWRLQKAREDNYELCQKTKALETTIEQQRTRQSHATHQQKTTITLVADSNRKKITKHLKEKLKEYEITETQNIYQTTDLQEFMIPRPPKTDITIVMMGTNDARLGKGETATKNLQQIADVVDNDKIIVSQIPPIEIGTKGEEKYEDIQADRRIINRLISNQFKHHVNITPLNIEQHNKGNILGDDGYHLTDEGGKKIADLIATATEKMIKTTKPKSRHPSQPATYPNQTATHPNQQDETQQKTQTITIPPGIGRHVVGRQGKTITEIKSRNKVEIQTGQPNEQDETIMKISGKKNNIDKAVEDITNIIDEHLERQRKMEERKREQEGIECRYFKEGHCRYGEGCWQKHTKEYRNRGNNTRGRETDRNENRRKTRSPSRNSNKYQARPQYQSTDRHQTKRLRQESPQSHPRYRYRTSSHGNSSQTESNNEKTLMENISDLVGDYLQVSRK